MSAPLAVMVYSPLFKVAAPAIAGEPTSPSVIGEPLVVTVTVTAEEVVLAPSASEATAVSVYEPGATDPQLNVNGAAVAVPIRVVPEKNSTRASRFSGSETEAASAMVAGATKVAPL